MCGARPTRIIGVESAGAVQRCVHEKGEPSLGSGFGQALPAPHPLVRAYTSGLDPNSQRDRDGRCISAPPGAWCPYFLRTSRRLTCPFCFATYAILFRRHSSTPLPPFLIVPIANRATITAFPIVSEGHHFAVAAQLGKLRAETSRQFDAALSGSKQLE